MLTSAHLAEDLAAQEKNQRSPALATSNDCRVRYDGIPVSKGGCLIDIVTEEGPVFRTEGVPIRSKKIPETNSLGA